MLFELCTGEPLFLPDEPTDKLLAEPKESWIARIRAWQGIDSDDRLARVFQTAQQELEDVDILAAQDLLQWCLQRGPTERPQLMVQILNHRFLKPEGGLLRADGATQVTIWYPDLQIETGRGSMLGEGAGGQVFLGMWRGHKVAVKKVAHGLEDEALREARLGRELHTDERGRPKVHANVLKMW